MDFEDIIKQIRNYHFNNYCVWLEEIPTLEMPHQGKLVLEETEKGPKLKFFALEKKNKDMPLPWVPSGHVRVVYEQGTLKDSMIAREIKQKIELLDSLSISSRMIPQ